MDKREKLSLMKWLPLEVIRIGARVPRGPAHLIGVERLSRGRRSTGTDEEAWTAVETKIEDSRTSHPHQEDASVRARAWAASELKKASSVSIRHCDPGMAHSR